MNIVQVKTYITTNQLSQISWDPTDTYLYSEWQTGVRVGDEPDVLPVQWVADRGAGRW